ncbi:unnamed protein product, partial [Mesorhabditis belari]|uniref:Nudix hydrolase domain-containing protein n=1 Tax=Mesorhabditis belari TaxID=2138241 RepID=A0AAF3EZP9_9BILA
MTIPKRVEIVGLSYPWIAYALEKDSTPLLYYVNPTNDTTQWEFPSTKTERMQRVYTETNLSYPWICFESKTRGKLYYVQPKLEKSIWKRPTDEDALQIPQPPLSKKEKGKTSSKRKTPILESTSKVRKKTVKRRELLNGAKRTFDDLVMEVTSIPSTSKNADLFYEQDFLVVCDTCSLLKEPDIIQFLIEHQVVTFIPIEVQGELDYRKNDPQFRKVVSALNRYLRSVTTITSTLYSPLLILEHALRRRDKLNLPDNDSKILASALELAQIGKEHDEFNVALLTEDNILAVRTNSYSDSGVSSTGVEFLKQTLMDKATRSGSRSNLNPSINKDLLEKIQAKLKASISNWPSAFDSTSKGQAPAPMRPNPTDEYSNRVAAFKFIMESVVEELMKRFCDSQRYGYKVELAANMQDLRRALTRSIHRNGQQCFNKFLHALERSFQWLDGSSHELEKMGPSPERWKLYGTLCMPIWNHLLCKQTMAFIHKKCRNTDIPYLHSNVHRFVVPEDKIKWSTEYPEYNPPDYTASSAIGKPYSDDKLEGIKWNNIDGKVNRISHIVNYSFDSKGRPLNPMGRTGLQGRGILGRWGPNHAADPLVTRCKNGRVQFVAIQRHDTGEWAIPGGMVDAGEEISATLKREFSEEALGGKDLRQLDALWKNKKELYRGYVDDPRNTDNAWMETVCVNFHDETGLLNDVELEAADDAKAVKWVDITTTEPLYASHVQFINILRQHLKI